MNTLIFSVLSCILFARFLNAVNKGTPEERNQKDCLCAEFHKTADYKEGFLYFCGKDLHNVKSCKHLVADAIYKCKRKPEEPTELWIKCTGHTLNCENACKNPKNHFTDFVYHICVNSKDSHECTP
jgi:hypothetical protein